MPAQTQGATARTVFYIDKDTAPAMVTDLVDEETQEPIDLTDPATTVVVNIAWSAPHGSYYTSPRDRIVDQAPCVIDPDQVTFPGRVRFFPGKTKDFDQLSPPGQYWYQHEVDFLGDTERVQTVPANTYQPLVIRAKVGGLSFAQAP